MNPTNETRTILPDDCNRWKTLGSPAGPPASPSTDRARRHRDADPCATARVRKSLAVFALLSTSLPAVALDVAKLTPPQAAYYRCMLERAALQGSQHDGVTWLAVKAARADCAAQRKTLHADLAAEAAVAGTLIGGGLPDESDIRRAADASLGAFDDALWPELTRVIEAK